MNSIPRTEREAKAKSKRKLKALKRRADAFLYDVAGMWDEGQVSGSIDIFLRDIDTGIESILEAIDTEIERSENDGAEMTCG